MMHLGGQYFGAYFLTLGELSEPTPLALTVEDLGHHLYLVYDEGLFTYRVEDL